MATPASLALHRRERYIMTMKKEYAFCLVVAVVLAGLALAALLKQPLFGLIGVLVAALAAWKLNSGGVQGWRSLGFVRPSRIAPTLAVGVAAALLTHAVIAIALPIASRFFGPPDLAQFAALQGRLDLLLVMLTIALVNGAFAEEIVFRGFIQKRLIGGGSGWNSRVVAGWLATSLAFGLAHGYQGMTGVIGTALAGAVFGAAMLVDRRIIWSAVIAHGLYDWSAMVVVFVRGVPSVA